MNKFKILRVSPFFSFSIFFTFLTTQFLFSTCPGFALERGRAELRSFSQSNSTSAIKVLFIGNSLIYVGEVPEVFVGLLKAKDAQTQVKVSEIIGDNFSLKDHIHDGTANSTITNNGPWDVVILQEQSAALSSDTPEAIRDAQILGKLALRCHSRVASYDAWITNAPIEFIQMNQKNDQFAAAIGGERIPVSTALVQARNIAGAKLYQQDHHHLGPDGVYLAACVIYAKLLRRSPQGLPNKIYSGDEVICEVEPSICTQLQAVAANYIR